jgi:hypothetical protein
MILVAFVFLKKKLLMNIPEVYFPQPKIILDTIPILTFTY